MQIERVIPRHTQTTGTSKTKPFPLILDHLWPITAQYGEGNYPPVCTSSVQALAQRLRSKTSLTQAAKCTNVTTVIVNTEVKLLVDLNSRER